MASFGNSTGEPVGSTPILPGREADHSPPTRAKVKKLWIYTSTPHTSTWRSA
jgi:hypothetical protein